MHTKARLPSVAKITMPGPLVVAMRPVSLKGRVDNREVVLAAHRCPDLLPIGREEGLVGVSPDVGDTFHLVGRVSMNVTELVTVDTATSVL